MGWFSTHRVTFLFTAAGRVPNAHLISFSLDFFPEAASRGGTKTLPQDGHGGSSSSSGATTG